MGGLFGIVSKENCSRSLFYGTDYHSHLGTENGGLAVFGENGFFNSIHSIGQAQFKSRFVDDYKKMFGHMGLGAIDDDSPQPLIIRSKFGAFAIAATGLITNKEKLTNILLANGDSFSEMEAGGINQAELVGKLICHGNDIVDGIVGMQDVIEGSICALIMTERGIYAARDRLGRFPLTLGEKIGGEDKSFAVATEASTFNNLGYQTVKYLGPGEVVLITPDKCETVKPAGDEKKVCSFLWIYTGYPSSSYEGIGVEGARERCGRLLARNDDVQADLVAGVPDSGVGHAIGYAMESGLPYRRPLVKYTPGYGRSYTPPSQEIRDLVATMKLSAVREIIEGRRMVVCEDSIVRGTQLKNFTINKLWGSGAREIHVRAACPPLIFPCVYATSTRTTSELAARRAITELEGGQPEDLRAYLDNQSAKYRQMVDVVRKDINVTSLKYLNIEDMIKAIGLPENDLCLYCWQGR
ncbi:MAG: amidophosphoribosyltransferase [Smithellaceae bacterium]|nr:amidophosphoribosyltransferase [Smithellaceae bacterium]